MNTKEDPYKFLHRVANNCLAIDAEDDEDEEEEELSEWEKKADYEASEADRQYDEIRSRQP